MKEIWTHTQLVIAGIGGWFGWFLGGYDGFLYALIAFVVLDYLLGVMCGIVEKHLSSDVGARGIFKKVVIFSLVGVAHIIDQNIICTKLERCIHQGFFINAWCVANLPFAFEQIRDRTIST